MKPRSIELLVAGAAHGAPTLEAARAEVRAVLLSEGLHPFHVKQLAELVVMHGATLSCPSMADVVRIVGPTLEVHEQAGEWALEFMREEGRALCAGDPRPADPRRDQLRRLLLVAHQLHQWPSHDAWKHVGRALELLETGPSESHQLVALHDACVVAVFQARAPHPKDSKDRPKLPIARLLVAETLKWNLRNLQPFAKLTVDQLLDALRKVEGEKPGRAKTRKPDKRTAAARLAEELYRLVGLKFPETGAATAIRKARSATRNPAKG